MARTPSTPRLSEAARHLVIPSGIVTSTFYRVNHRLRSVGVQFDPWQEGFGATALGCRKDGKYAATVGGVAASIPRQVGKTFTVGNLLIGLALEFPGLRVVWTSHHNRTTTNTFRSMQGMVRRRKMWPHVEAIRTANGEQEIRFKNGSIVMFGAREQGFGRGMDAIDVLVFDEAQILGLKALEDTGLWVFSRRSATSDITPIQSATYALWGAQSKRIVRPLSASTRRGGRRYATRSTTRRGSA